MDVPPGATGLLVGAISYMLGVCAMVGPGDMTLPTPCAEWDLAMLLAHLSASMADLETAIRTGILDLKHLPANVAGDPVETLRDRAAELLCAVYGYDGAGRFVAVAGLPVPAGLVACTGAVEIAVHGWDVSVARGAAGRGRVRPVNPQEPVSPKERVRPIEPVSSKEPVSPIEPLRLIEPVRPIPAALASRMLGLCPLLVAGREGLFADPVEVAAQASPGDKLVAFLGRDPGTRLRGPALVTGE
jgi:uncharacterized protein (TIGR03086 family)